MTCDGCQALAEPGLVLLSPVTRHLSPAALLEGEQASNTLGAIDPPR